MYQATASTTKRMTARKPPKSNAGSVVPSRPAKESNADSTAISGTPAGIRLCPPKRQKRV